jgi:SAM-dependent methyltransferase
MSDLTLACPRCGTRLTEAGTCRLRCPIDGLEYTCTKGIWRFLLPERELYFSQFVQDYETIRRAEGRGASDPAWYRALPFEDITSRYSADWRVRRHSYEVLLNRVIAPMERTRRRTLKVADLGAGNCWLSNQLSARGHDLAAIDLLTNDFDGLGAHIHYETEFTLIQAEFDRLPVESNRFDLVIFNGSFHYSIDYTNTLVEALRILRADGKLVLMDSPIYHNSASGRQMVRERAAQFERCHGFRSDALPSQNFLTYSRMETLASDLYLKWQIFRPFYGWRWALRPLRARLRGHREPAKFHVIAGERV